jgi:hypothetical protein
VKHETCHKRTPSIDVTVKDCRRFYAESVENPKAEGLQACSQCDRGKTLYFSKKPTKTGGKKKEKIVKKPIAVKPKPQKPAKTPRAAKAVLKAKPGRKAIRHSSLPPETGLLVDFRGYPQLYARLVEAASEEHRTPELQIVHILDTRFSVRDTLAADKTKK